LFCKNYRHGSEEAGVNDEFILEMKNIVKTFPGVQALRGVDLKVRKGEIHALLGETAPANRH
jgi:ABC-type sugar transport system ATPase subunit